MANLPEPPPTSGLTWRPWSRSDAEALARHALRVHEAERLEHVPGAAVFKSLADQEGFDPAIDSLIGVDEAGEVQAEAGAWNHITENGARVFIWADADPGFENLKPFLVRWAEARARQELEAVPDTVERIIRFVVEEHRATHRRVAEEAGFEAARSFAVMRRPLSGLPTAVPLPDGIAVESWSPDRDEGIRITNNEAFADHWGSLPVSEAMWIKMYRESSEFRPDLTFVATAGGEVVSFCIVEFDPEDVETRGIVEYYINKVGTRPAFRGAGVASHLITRSLHAAAAAGGEVAALEVDEKSHTNATEVYRRLGFEVSERSIHYLKRV